MELIVFVLAAAMMLIGAVGVIVNRHPVHAALGLILTLFGVAVQFVALNAHFLAAVEIIVYAGAIVVLFLFVIMLLGVDKLDHLNVEPIPLQRPIAAIVGVGLSAIVIAAVVHARNIIAIAPDKLDSQGDSNIQQLAADLFGDHVFAFEFTSILLIVAVVGTVLMTRKSKRTVGEGGE